jgi:glycerol-1-phosphate dehydrogenase [NAD(P)+]
MNMADLIKDFNIDTAQIGNNDCPCGRKHTANVKEIIIQQGALNRVPSIIKKYGGSNVFIIADKNTYNAAGQLVCEYMKHENLRFSLFVFDNEHLEPDEWAVGQAVMHYDSECDFILGIGSGTINDIGKIVAHTTGLPYMIVGTAPSMDGYASSTSSVVRDGIKISLNSVCPTVIVADLDVMCQAPTILLQAGIGDMLAKYISICEWSISHVITGEYYCEEVASIVRKATKKCACIENLSDIGPENVRPLIEGLIIAGIAMSFAGLSRPASGMEHYFSHIWDMRGLEFNTPNISFESFVKTSSASLNVGTFCPLNFSLNHLPASNCLISFKVLSLKCPSPSVVLETFPSCMITGILSFDNHTSNSIASTPSSIAASYEIRVFSGYFAQYPRCPSTIIFFMLNPHLNYF